MSDYPFALLQAEPEAAKAALAQRPFIHRPADKAAEAARFVSSPALDNALHAAIALGQPLLLEGESGSGKTLAAYYLAQRLQLGAVLHFQVKSLSQAQDLLYQFDSVRYFHDAQKAVEKKPANKAHYLEPRAFWQALASAEPRVLLIDDVDQASADFLYDLLYELENMSFQIPELGKAYNAPAPRRPLLLLTSRGERQLPDALLRRCVFHRLELDKTSFTRLVDAHQADFSALNPSFVQLALERFLTLRTQNLKRLPSAAELLAWLRVLAAAHGSYPERLDMTLGELPFIEVLIKDADDLRELRSKA